MSKIWLRRISNFLSKNSNYGTNRCVQQVCHRRNKTLSCHVACFRNMHGDPKWPASTSTFMKLKCPASSVPIHASWGSIHPRWVSTDHNSELSDLTYERIVNEALEDFTEYFESLDELENCPKEYDVQYSDGVLTVSLGSEHGTYVINKQTPNKQIWLSSPISGPKRYDFSKGRWIYSHESRDLHALLTEEMTQIFQEPVDFSQLGKDS